MKQIGSNKKLLLINHSGRAYGLSTLCFHSREPAEIRTMTLVPKRRLAINMQEHAVWRARRNMKHVYKISLEDQAMALRPEDEYTSKLYKHTASETQILPLRKFESEISILSVSFKVLQLNANTLTHFSLHTETLDRSRWLLWFGFLY